MATMKDVAKMAGVSIGTVSNYLNHTHPVSTEASLKIQAAAAALRYSPNLSAKSLRTNTYSDVGIILPHFDNSYYVQIFQGIESILKPAGYIPNLAFSYDIPDVEAALLQDMMKKQIQGLILVPSQPDNWKFYHDHFMYTARPLVLLDRSVRDLDANLVAFDNYALIRQITSDLLDKGHRNIILFSGPQKFECEVNCASGFQSAFRAKGLTVDSSKWISTNTTKEDAFRQTLQLLQQTVPDSILVISESLACGVVEGLRFLGYSGEEIPVFTLAGECWNHYTHSFATSIGSLPVFQLGKTAASTLLNHMKNAQIKDTERIIIRPTPPRLSDVIRNPIGSVQWQETPVPERTLRILMMDTPQVHSLMKILKNFECQWQIKTDVTILPHSQMYTAIVENYSSTSEKPFDVLMYDIPWITALVLNGLLADVTEAVDSFASDLFLSNCREYFTDFNHRHYGIPFMYAPQILYYRKDLFENSEIKAEYFKQNNVKLRPPLSLKEYNVIANFFTNSTDAIPYGIAFPAAHDECLAPEIYMRLLTCGSRLFDSKGNVCLNQGSSLAAYINLIRSVRVSKPDCRSCTDTSIVRDFFNGETAMLISYPSFLCDVVDLQRSNQIGTIGYHRIPASRSVLGGWSLGISSRSTQQQEAISFLKWLCDDQISTYFTLMGGQTAITKNYTNDELTKLYPWLSLYYDSYSHCTPIVPPKLGDRVFLSQRDIDATVCKWIYQLLTGEIDVSEALEATHAELESLIQSKRQMRAKME